MIQLCWWLMIPVMIWPHSSEASSRLTHSRLRASFCAIVWMWSPAKAAPAILTRRVVRTASRRLLDFFVLFSIRWLVGLGDKIVNRSRSPQDFIRDTLERAGWRLRIP